jgi:hypothetical protein
MRDRSLTLDETLVCICYMFINIFRLKQYSNNPTTHAEMELSRMSPVSKCHDHSSNPVSILLSHIFYHSYLILLEHTPFLLSQLKPQNARSSRKQGCNSHRRGQWIGQGIATKFVQEGAKVIIADLAQDNGSRVTKELGCEFHLSNVTKRDDWEALLRKVLDKHG